MKKICLLLLVGIPAIGLARSLTPAQSAAFKATCSDEDVAVMIRNNLVSERRMELENSGGGLTDERLKEIEVQLGAYRTSLKDLTLGAVSFSPTAITTYDAEYSEITRPGYVVNYKKDKSSENSPYPVSFMIHESLGCLMNGAEYSMYNKNDELISAGELFPGAPSTVNSPRGTTEEKPSTPQTGATSETPQAGQR